MTRLKHRLGWETLEPGPVRITPGFRHPIDVAERDSLVNRYRLDFRESAERELHEAQRLLRHEFHLLGHTMHHGARIAWSRDPVSGTDWSHGYSADISYRGPQRLGDIKLPWELNKHQYLFTLGKAAWLTGDARYAREVVKQIAEWIEDNPCHSGIHWISALETGTRAISWILAYPFFAEQCAGESLARMLRSIGQHLLFVERNLSAERHANTHLTGEAAVLTIGALFLNCRHSQRWFELGLRHLEEQLFEQVRRDGVHAEQSVAYHRYNLDQYYLVDAFLRVNGSSLSSAALERLERMTEFLRDVLHPDGSAPAFGDCDDARGIWCHARCTIDYRSLLALGAVRFGRGDFKHAAGGATEEVLWLYGEQGLRTFAALTPQTPSQISTGYPEAGYYVMRSGWGAHDAMLVFDCGPLGHGSAGHGHADALSFQLFARGYRFCVDSGTYSYNLDYDLRNRFRSTIAHNTVMIDGFDQSTPSDRMKWADAARARCRLWRTKSGFDLIDAEHDGYRRLTDPVSHRRIVTFIKPDVWVICDLLRGAQAHEYEWLLHLRPDCRAELRGNQVRLSAPSGASLTMHIARHVTNDRGGEGTISCELKDDWYSEEYGRRCATRTIRAHGWFNGEAVVTAALSACEDVDIGVELSHGVLNIQIHRRGCLAEQLSYRYMDAAAPCTVENHDNASVSFRPAADTAAEIQSQLNNS